MGGGFPQEATHGKISILEWLTGFYGRKDEWGTHHCFRAQKLNASTWKPNEVYKETENINFDYYYNASIQKHIGNMLSNENTVIDKI